MAPAKKGGEKKGRSTLNEVVTREYTINIHKRIHGVGFKKRAARALKEIRKFAMKEMGTRNVRCASTPGSTKPPGPKESGMSHIGPMCGCPENVMKTKTSQTSSTLWLPTCPSPPSKIYSQCGWELIADGPIKLLNCLRKKKKRITMLHTWNYYCKSTILSLKRVHFQKKKKKCTSSPLSTW